MSVYKSIITKLDGIVPARFQPLWNHPAGPKTIFFWAPLIKWSIVIAGINDVILRPPDSISIRQNCALCATGLIWSRYSMVIIPPNYSLLSVNLFIAGVSVVQIFRAYNYQSNLPAK